MQRNSTMPEDGRTPASPPPSPANEHAPQRRILVVEDDCVVVDLVAPLLAPLAHVTFAGSIAEANEKLRAELPEVVFVDLELPDGDGVELIRVLRRAHPSLPLVVLTVAASEERILAAIHAGASGYLFKSDMVRGLGTAIDEALSGGAPMSKAVARLVLRQVQTTVDKLTPVPRSQRELLSAREVELLELFADGLTYAEASEHLDVSENTVRTHVRSIYEKLDVTTKTSAVMEGMRLGLMKRRE